MSSPISNVAAFGAGLHQAFQSSVTSVRKEVAQRNQDVKQAFQDFQSGDTAGAQQSIDAAKQLTTQIKADRSSLTSLRTDAQARQSDIASFKQAVQSGDASAAHAALDKVLADTQQLRTGFANLNHGQDPSGGGVNTSGSTTGIVSQYSDSFGGGPSSSGSGTSTPPAVNVQA